MLTKDHISEFQKKGFTVLTNGVQEEELNLLHEEADTLSNYLMSEGYDLITDLGCVVEPWTCGYLDLPEEAKNYKTDAYEYSRIRDTLYWPNTCITTTTASHIILDKYGNYAAQLLDQKTVYLLNEQFIIKPPTTRSSSSFAWHRDSDYYRDDRHRDICSIACWTALDSVTEHNGTIEIEDFLGTHHTICAEAGTIVFMSDQLVHKSTCNLSSKFRRVYMNQFSASPLYHLDSDQQCLALAVPSPFQNSLP
ncbi:hypothetical protein EDC94DRAFT_622292 [Helicostylum pulchrum]|nr:hypothetical protein EDC94DRAFT_622292 [Helicostylum pulchrum]